MRDAAEAIVIEPKKGWMPVNFREVWRFRELLYFLAWRDVKVKYKQTALGVVWALMQPVLTMLIFSVLFGRFARMPSDGAPYPIFVFIGLLPWNYFSSVLGQSTNSLVAGSNLVSKIYFPRLIIPASSAIAALLDLAIGFTVLAALMLYYGVAVSAGALLVPFLVLVTLMNAVGFGLWFSALNVKYRDIQHVIPFIIQIWMFVTPVIYPKSLFGEKWGWLLLLNPMGGVIEAFRPAVLGHMPIPWASLFISSAIGLAVFAGGVFYFRRVERYFADII
ncbi:MAG: ABC transporter permease [Deltaproteobacteria bacterium]|nr:ABC transporter permease [Deltaproteobacteria bacterium]